MCDSIKAIAYSGIKGAMICGVIGYGVGTLSAPSTCGGLAVTNLFLNRFLNGPSSRDIDQGFASYNECSTAMPIAIGTACAVAGGVIGLTYGIANVIFKKWYSSAAHA